MSETRAWQIAAEANRLRLPPAAALRRAGLPVRDGLGWADVVRAIAGGAVHHG